MAPSRSAVAVALAAVAIVCAPAPAQAMAPAGCDVEGATLTWGFKESFRAYIDGDIANGEWTTAGDASYTTPAFAWSGGSGTFDPRTGEGLVSFTGSVRFTGHGGVLDTTIADPAIRFDGEGGAVLLLDVSGPAMDGSQVDAVDTEFVELTAPETGGADALVTVDAGTVLTEAGHDAFANYEAGAAFDPVRIAMPVGDTCEPPAPGDGTPGDAQGEDPGTGDPADSTADDTAAWVGAGAAGGLAVLLAGAALLVARGRRRAD
ncbi:MAG: HtaA domain-containing protein [Schumannella sp.]